VNSVFRDVCVGWWPGVVVTRFIRSTKLLCVGLG